jgi:hypothetical protein
MFCALKQKVGDVNTGDKMAAKTGYGLISTGNGMWLNFEENCAEN